MERCVSCGFALDVVGDHWNSLCSGCADAMSEALDRLGLSDEHTHAFVEVMHAFAIRMTG